MFSCCVARTSQVIAVRWRFSDQFVTDRKRKTLEFRGNLHRTIVKLIEISVKSNSEIDMSFRDGIKISIECENSTRKLQQIDRSADFGGTKKI